MNKSYCFETIEDCEKEIIDKTIILDINHSSNANLFNCFVRMIRTLMIWGIGIYTPIVFYKDGFIESLKAFGICMCIYFVWYLLISWVKYNFEQSFISMKTQLINNLILDCKEFNESNYEEWQVKQMLKRFAELGRLNG